MGVEARLGVGVRCVLGRSGDFEREVKDVCSDC